MSLSVSSYSPNQSPLKFSSPDKISNLKSSPGPQEYQFNSLPISLKIINSVIIPHSPEEIVSLFNKKEVLISKLLEDNKNLSAFIHHNDLTRLRQDKEKLEQESASKEAEIQKLRQILEPSLKKQLLSDSELRVSVQRSPETVFIELPENRFLEEVLEKQVKEFKSKIKEMALEIEKEKRMNEELLRRNEGFEGIVKSNEEKLVMLSTELQRLTTVLQELRNQVANTQRENGVLRDNERVLKENERIHIENERVFKENEKRLLGIKAGLEERVKGLGLELEKRLEDERNYKSAISSSLRQLKEQEEKLQGLFERVRGKEEKVREIEEKVNGVKGRREGHLQQVNEALEGQKQMFKRKFEEISKLYEEALEKIAVQEKIIDQFRKANNDVSGIIKDRENELVLLRKANTDALTIIKDRETELGLLRQNKDMDMIMRDRQRLEEVIVQISAENDRLTSEMSFLKQQPRTIVESNEFTFRDKVKLEEALLTLRNENDRLQKLLSDQNNRSHLLEEKHSTDNQKFLLILENENLRKLIVDHYNGYLVVTRNNDLQAGLRVESQINELREKLNTIIKEFNKNINDYTNSQVIFAETLKEKKSLDEQLTHRNKEFKDCENRNQELLAKTLVMNSEILRLSQAIKQLEGEFESRNLMAHTEIENLKSALKFKGQENESLRKSNEHLMRYSSFESELITLKQELENSEMKYLEKIKENELLKRKLTENTERLTERTETMKKAAQDRENFKVNELEIELKFAKQENEHLSKVKQEQLVQLGQLKAALVELENEKTAQKLSNAELRSRIQALEEDKERLGNEYIAKSIFESQASQFKSRIDKLEHEKGLKEYENESLKSSLKAKEKLEEEVERMKDRSNELEKEIAFLKKRLMEDEEVRKENLVLNEKIQMLDAKNKQITREMQEMNELRKKNDSDLLRKNEEIEGVKASEAKLREMYSKQAFSAAEIERLHAIIREKNEDNRRFNIEISDLQKEIEKNREAMRNYSELKVIIESLKGENEELNVNLYKSKEEIAKLNRLDEENHVLREKNREVEGFNKENLRKILEYQKFSEKVEFENEKLKNLMFERLKEIENLKRKIAEISSVYEVNANSAKEKFEDIICNFLKEDKNVLMNAERNRICEEPVRISEKTEKKVSKKRTKSYLYENENDFQIKEEEDLGSQLNLYENMMKMISFELSNLSQFKDTRTIEIKKIKGKIFKLKQSLEQSVFVLEEKNLKFQDLLLQACNIEKKMEKFNLEDK